MKKLLSILLTVLMLGFVAAPVSAQTVWDGTSDISWYDDGQTSFDISTPEQLAGVAQLVNSGTSFNGKTLHLTADLWLNSTGDSTNNWVPIGGSATATSEAQSSGNSFRGVFNGHGHTIYNLYCEKTNYFHAGLFGCIQNPCTIDSLVLINPTVKSCGMMGAIAGMSRSGGQIYIRYCLVVNANIVGTPGNTGPSASHNNIGGILGANYPNSSGTYIQNCGVTGNISGYYIGGIGGNAQYDYITNCYFAGTLTPYNTNYGGMTAHDGNRTNCYSYTVVNGNQTQSSASNDGTSVTQAEMQDPQMIVNLGDAFKMDNGINNGYPVMSYMAGVDPVAAEICAGESLTITAFGFDTYAWSNGSTSDVITVSPTSSTTYTVTCTANGVSTVLTSSVTVYPQAVINATVAASSDGQVHATITPETATVACGSSDNVTFTVTPDEHWRVASVYMNGVQQYDAQTYGPFTFTVNPGGTLANVVVHMTNALTCTNVQNLEASNIFGSNATVSWNAHTTGELSEYHIVVRDVVAETEDEYTTTDLSYVIMGLNENTMYQVGVYTFCLDGYGSDTTFVSFMTPCNSPVNVPVGDGTSTNSYLPTYIYYGNTYSQQILPASVIGSDPAVFSSISFFDTYSSTNTRACDIYLVSLPVGMNLNDGWILPDSANGIVFQQVFSGNIDFGGNNWVEVLFDTPFSYDGVNNIMVVVNDHTNSWVSTHNFRVHEDATTQSMSRYAYRDGTSYNAFNPGVTGTKLNVVNNIRLGFCDESTCIRPNTVTASNVTENSADIAWVTVGSESSWEVEYKAAADTEWTSAGTVSSAEAYLTGLNGNTQYSVRVRALCGGSDMSLWTDVISFRTECASITQLPFSEDFEDASAIYSTSQDNYILCWDRYASNSSHYVYIPSNTYAHSGTRFLDFHHTDGCFNIAIMPAVDESISISDLMVSFYACRTGSSGTLEVGVMSDKTDPTTFVVMDTINLSSYNTYEYGLQQVSFENYADNGRYVAFRVSNAVSCGFYVDDVLLEERPMCLYPTNFHAVNVSNEEVTLGWTEPGNATAWNILYDVTGFDPETEGTTVAADANPYTVTGLTNITTYDFYVQADCGGLTSDWVGPLTLKTGVYNMGVTGSDTLTTCGSYIYDDGGAEGNHSTSCDYTLVVYPATPGSGLSLSGSVNLYSGSSYYQGFLRIYEGVGTTGNLLGEFSGTQTVNVACGGPVTLRLTTGSYSYYNYAGFEILAQCTDCFPPSNLAVSGQTLDGATVTWSGSADSYEVVLGGAMSQTYTTTDTTYTFTGLTSSSSYTVKVRGICGADTSLYSQTANFNTSCGAITVTADNPWFEDFEGYTGGGAHSFVCWETPVTEVVDNGTSPFVYCGHSPSCHSGANSAELKGSNNMLVLPEFSNDIQDLRLSFWATTTSTSNYGTVEIGYITDINDPTTFVALGPAGTPGPRGSGSASGNGNFMGPFDFNGVTATTARIAIKFTGYSGLSWNLDDFTVSLAPNCPSPVKTSVQASNIDGHNATISFTDDDPDHNSWTVYYKPSADSVWDQVVTTTTTTTLTNLDPQTQYDVYVVTNCATPDATEDQTLTIHFTTTVACPAPQNVTISNIGMTTATVNWFSNADSFTIEYGETGFTVGNGTIATTTANTYDLTGLTSGTAYTVYITADCGLDGTSTAATVNFNTNLCEVADQCQYTFNLTDSYGDGWNGGSITVQQNGITVATVGLTSGSSNTVAVTLCDAQSTTLIWNSGSYDYEVSFEVVSAYGDIVYTASSVSSGTLTSFISNCTPPTCPKPTLLTVTNVTSNTVSLEWQAGGSESSWEIAYGAPGFDPATAMNVETATTNPYTLQNLTDATSYQFYVRAVCSVDDQSDWSTPVSAITPCGGNLPLPYTMDFEGYTGTTYDDANGIAPACWTTYSANTSYGPPHIVSSGSYHYASSGNSMVFTCSSSGANAYAALPTFTQPLNTLKLNFWRAMESTTQGELTVGYVTNLGDLASSYVVVATIPSVSSSNGDTISVLFNDASIPATGNICFRWYKESTYYSCCIDDVNVTLCDSSAPVIPTDPTVATNAAESIMQTTATLKATITNPDNVNITAKGFQWKATTGGTYTSVTGTGTGNTFTANLTNLTPNTSYTYKAFITFNGTTVEGSEMTFTTLPEDTPEPCEVPTGLHTTDVQNESIAIAWDANADVNSWNIQYRPQNGTWSSATSNTNSYTITGLTGHTTYEIQVQANCGDGNVSDWSGSISEETTNVGIDSWLEKSVSLYPNPAREYIDIRVDGDLNVTMMEVYDVYGKLINTVNDIDNPTRINVNGLADGMYFVRVTTEKGAVTKTFVKR